MERQDDQTGRNLNRTGLIEIKAEMDAYRRRGHKVIFVVYEQDRLNRKYTDYAGLREKLMLNGIEIYYSRDKSKVASSAYDRIGDDIKALLAEAELEKIAERTHRGRRQKVLEGNIIGGGSAPYGYSYVGRGRDRKLAINPEEAAVVQTIFALYAYGEAGKRYTVPDIMLYLNTHQPTTPGRVDYIRKRSTGEWATATIYRILRRRAYIGEYEQFRYRSVKDADGKTRMLSTGADERVIVRSPELSIIDENTWTAAQNRLSVGRQTSYRNNSDTGSKFLVGRRIRCGKCGLAYCGRSAGKPGVPRQGGGYRAVHTYYYCTSSGTSTTIINPCSMPYIRANKVDAAIWRWVTTKLTNPDWLRYTLSLRRDDAEAQQAELRERITTAKRQLATAEKEIIDATMLVVRGLAPESVLAAMKPHYDEKSERLRQSIEEYERRLASVPTEEQITSLVEWTARFRRVAEQATPEERRQFIELCDLRVVVMPESTKERPLLKVSAIYTVEDVITVEDETGGNGSTSGGEREGSEELSIVSQISGCCTSLRASFHSPCAQLQALAHSLKTEHVPPAKVSSLVYHCHVLTRIVPKQRACEHTDAMH